VERSRSVIRISEHRQERRVRSGESHPWTDPQWRQSHSQEAVRDRCVTVHGGRKTTRSGYRRVDRFDSGNIYVHEKAVRLRSPKDGNREGSHICRRIARSWPDQDHSIRDNFAYPSLYRISRVRQSWTSAASILRMSPTFMDPACDQGRPSGNLRHAALGREPEKGGRGQCGWALNVQINGVR